MWGEKGMKSVTGLMPQNISDDLWSSLYDKKPLFLNTTYNCNGNRGIYTSNVNVQMYLICRVVTTFLIKFCYLEKNIQLKAWLSRRLPFFYQHGVADTQQYNTR